VAVQDNGVGIKTEDMPKLFREFGQVDPGLGCQHQGTGLGLALCKSFVEMPGGMVGAGSLSGFGSTLCFKLPVEGLVRPTAFAASINNSSMAS
jgi:signal transduction histidine kinase